jgi:hypothetical protein
MITRKPGRTVRPGVEALERRLALSDNCIQYPITITPIAVTQSQTTPGAFIAFGQFPALNNNGTVAFQGIQGVFGPSLPGIFTGNGGPITTIASTANAPFTAFGPASINDAGSVAFKGFRQAGGEGIYTGSGGPITTITDSNISIWSHFSPPDINNSGTVAFETATGDNKTQTISTGSGGPLTTLAYNLSPGSPNGQFLDFGPTNGNNPPSLQDNGHVAFGGTLVAGPQGIFVGQNGPADTSVITSGGQFKSFSSPAINIWGQMAFQAKLQGGGQGIFTESPQLKGYSLQDIEDSTGLFKSFGAPAINGTTFVAFKAMTPNVGGIFFEDRGSPHNPFTVIALGDSLMNSTVTDLQFGQEGLNDNLQFAFYAKLADGRSGIFRAQATPFNTCGTIVAQNTPSRLTRFPLIDVNSASDTLVDVISTADFNAQNVDTSNLDTLTFGERAVTPRVSATSVEWTDVNGDGVLDLRLHFSTPALKAAGALVRGPGLAELEGLTMRDSSLHGMRFRFTGRVLVIARRDRGPNRGGAGSPSDPATGAQSVAPVSGSPTSIDLMALVAQRKKNQRTSVAGGLRNPIHPPFTV